MIKVTRKRKPNAWYILNSFLDNKLYIDKVRNIAEIRERSILINVGSVKAPKS